MNKLLVGALLIGVAGLGAYIYWDKQQAATGENTTVEVENENRQAVPQGEYAWTFTPEGEDETGMPRTRVSVRSSAGVMKDLGVYDGTCMQIKGSSWSLVEGEIDGAICWWAGGGKEIGIFAENGTHVIKIGDLDEGSEETPGVRGNFQTLITL